MNGQMEHRVDGQLVGQWTVGECVCVCEAIGPTYHKVANDHDKQEDEQAQ